MTTKKVPEILIKINKFEETELLRRKNTLQASITHIAEEIFDINKRITGEMEKGVNVDLYRYLEASRKKIHKYNGEIANLKEQESLLNKQMQDTFNEGRKIKNLKKIKPNLKQAALHLWQIKSKMGLITQKTHLRKCLASNLLFTLLLVQEFLHTCKNFCELHLQTHSSLEVLLARNLQIPKVLLTLSYLLIPLLEF